MLRIFPRSSASDTDALARDIAERGVAEVTRRLAASAAAMSVAELRGYVRAGAMGIVRMHARQLAAERGLPRVQVDVLTAAALERTVHLVVRELVAPPVVVIPAPHVRPRTAA